MLQSTNALAAGKEEIEQKATEVTELISSKFVVAPVVRCEIALMLPTSAEIEVDDLCELQIILVFARRRLAAGR